MALISELDVREFRGIRQCAKPIKFSNFTVLIGRNNSGKSSVLEALSLLPYPFDHPLRHIGMSKVQLLNFLHQNPVDNKVSNLLYRYSGSAEIDYTYMDNELSLVLDQTGRFNLSYRGEEAVPGKLHHRE